MIAGRYTLEAEVGRGGMGAVWRARDEHLGRTVALKKIGIGPGGITPDARRAEREAKLAARLNHANVVAVFDLVEDTTGGQSQQWLVMEYVAGTDLAQLIRQRGRLSPDEAAPILAQAASALAAAHGAGIVHRDVKPSNILVATDGQVKLNDFGIARTAADPALTQTGLVTGSPAYLSPEVASGQPATAASDAWSWGATLFHAHEGRPPYQVGDNLLGALYRIVHEEPPRSESAGWLAPVLAATMTREPTQRWPMTAAEQFLREGPRHTQRSSDDGTRVLPMATPPAAPAPSGPPPGPPPGALPHREPRRRPWLVVAAAAVAVVVAMAVAFAIGMHDGGDDDSTQASGGSGPTAGSSPSASDSAAREPTEAAMEEFVRSYLDTVVHDPAAAFDMLTPDFQQQSGGMQGYLGFWEDVRSAKVIDISADPAKLQVAYTYRYEKPPGGPQEDHVVLRLSYDDGSFLIADEL